MNISLTPELEKYVIQKSSNGLYHSASEVIRQALRVFIESENQQTPRIKQLNREIETGLAELSRGDRISGEAVFSEIREMSLVRKKKSIS
ncbi:MAG: type II toxin-antitoxin system ParD family antitoxin [Myxococcaceae bacterium]